MLRVYKQLALAVLAVLLLTGCRRECPMQTGDEAISVPTETAISTTPPTTDLSSVTETTAASTPSAQSEPSLLPAGMLVYSQDFDDFPDSNGTTVLRWTLNGQSTTARRAIRNHRLYFTNLPQEGRAYFDAVYLLGNALPEDLTQYPFTLQYDIEYIVGEAGACAGMTSPADAAGLPTAALRDTPVTVRLEWKPEVGFTVWQKRAGETDFVKTGDPVPGAKGQVFVYLGPCEGYLDNIRLWIGHGDTPDANVLCYWQWQIMNIPQTEGGAE